MFSSSMIECGRVPFPEFRQERHYMLPFKQVEGLPHELRSWQPTVDAMLDGITTDQPIYFMVDQSVVEPGKAHRRPGVHVDGYWVPDLKAHGGGHTGGGRGRHSTAGGRWDTGGGWWWKCDFSEPEALILASDVSGANAFVGEYDPKYIGEGGSYDGPLDDLNQLDMMDHRVYVGTVGTLHQSLPLLRGGPRTVVRLNCPGVTLH